MTHREQRLQFFSKTEHKITLTGLPKWWTVEDLLCESSMDMAFAPAFFIKPTVFSNGKILHGIFRGCMR